MEITKNDFNEIQHKLQSSEFAQGLEFYPFCIGWYNERVNEKFRLSYPDNTLAFCIINTPSFFDEQFLKFLKSANLSSFTDPLDQCLTFLLNNIKTEFKRDTKIIHDFDLHFRLRRPKVLVQTAGHASGAAYYYQKHDISNPPWDEKRKMFGVSSHSLYGGWFSFRGVLIFTDTETPFLEIVEPVNNLTENEIIDLLEKFNGNWQDWTFRDVGKPTSRYGESQKEYFLTKPSERFSLVRSYSNVIN